MLYALLERHNPDALLTPDMLGDVRYVVSTAAAATAMATMGVVLVSVSLFLGGPLGLRPGVIGLITFTLAGAMTLFAPVSPRLAQRWTRRAVLQGGLGMLAAGPLLLATVSTVLSGGWRLAAITACLVLVGCGIAATQSTAAFALMRSSAAAHGGALGVHNMMRFTGLAVGYAWVAVTYPSGSLYLVHAGPVLLATATLVLTVVGPPAPPLEEDRVANRR